MGRKALRVIDIYCGAGGFSLGFKQAGFDIVLGIDRWNKALVTYESNIEVPTLCIDILKLDINTLPECDIIIGGPPCPDFSVQRYANATLGLKHPDTALLRKFHEIIDTLKPKYWVGENVRGIKPFLGDIPSALLDTQDYGMPQRRKRLFWGRFFTPPQKTNYYDSIAPTIVAWELRGGWQTAHGRRFSQWLGYKPSIYEMLYYMGFPPDFKVFGNQGEQSMQVGNAVCPPLAKMLAEEIKRRG